MKKFNATLPPLTKLGMKVIQKRILSEKDKTLERNAHKVMLCSSLILDVIDDLYVPEDSVKQKELLIKICEDAVGCTSGVKSYQFKFNSSNYLQALCQEVDNMIVRTFGNGPLIKAFVMINVYFITLDERQRKVLDRVIDERGEYIYELLKYLQFATDNKYTFNEMKEFSNQVSRLILINYKSMYSGI